jgi:hypothetical protein
VDKKELQELIDTSSEQLKVRVWKNKLDDIKQALVALFEKQRDGKILFDVA